MITSVKFGKGGDLSAQLKYTRIKAGGDTYTATVAEAASISNPSYTNPLLLMPFY